ncbi:MAG: DUF4340 domain-containing protein [Maricaulaceae bacterium]|jgi:hypothetical protein
MTARADAKRQRAATRLWIAAAVLAALAVAAVGRDVAGRRIEIADGPALPDWSEEAVGAALIVVTTSEETLTLERRGATWSLIERGGYAVAPDALDAFARSFAAMRRAGASTRDSGNHVRLGVVEPSGGESAEPRPGAGVRVRVEDARGGEIADLIIGAERRGAASVPSGGGVFVRRTGENEAFAVDGAPPDVGAPAFWLDLDLLGVAREDIARVEITPEGGGLTYRVARESRDAADFVIAEPAGAWTLMTEGAANGPGGAIATLRFVDVAPEASFRGDLVARHSATTFDGLTVSLDIYARGAERWVDVSAIVSAETSATTPEARSAAERLEAATRGWMYQLPEFAGDRLARPLDRIARPRTE